MTITVRRTPILTTNYVVYTAWEPSGDTPNGCQHSTIRYADDGWVGKVGTKVSGCALPHGDERTAAVRAHYAAEYARAYAAILAEYPHLENAPRDMGEITEYLNDEP